jgi:glutamate-1-semialdehyde 2,1-aminomutase
MIIKFEGHYHGWTDVLAVSTRPSEKNVGPFDSPNRDVMTLGIPSAVSNDVLVLPWNDRSILTAAMNRHKDRLAAIITEPIAANNACTMPTKGFLEFLQSECQNRGIVLIFDEVCTGFRVAPGGAQGLYGVRPDLSIFSKALGGGLPISAFGGSKAIMELVASDKVRHGGTYNGNSLCTAGSLAVLRELRDKSIQFRIKSHGSLIMHSLVTSARDHEIPCVVQGIPSMFQIVFGLTKPTQQYRQLLHADAKLYTLFREALLENGVHITPSHLAYWTVSASHTNEDAETTKFAIASAMKRVSDARGK